MMVNSIIKKPVSRKKQSNRFSLRLKHPRAISICASLTKEQMLSSYLERLILRDSLTIGKDKKSLSEYKQKLLDEIKVEKQTIDTEIKRLKALKESHIFSLQKQLEEVNKFIEKMGEENESSERKI